MATENRIDFKVRVTDEGLAPLANTLERVDAKTDDLAQGADQAGTKLAELGTDAASAADKADALGQGAGQAATRLGTLGTQAASAGQQTDDLGKSSERAADGIEAATKAASAKEAAIKSGLDVSRSEIELSKRTLELHQAQQQGVLQLARAKGDGAAATQASNRLLQIEAEQLALGATAKRAEAAAVQATTDARREALAAIGPLTQAQLRELQAADNTAKALRTEAAAADEAARQVGQLGTELGNAADQGPRLDSALSAVSKAVAGLFALDKAKDFAFSTIGLADAYGQMAERIAMATPVASEYDRVQQRILDTANLTYRSLSEQQELYIRTADALRSMAYNTEEVLDITDSFSYLLTTNAATVERGQAAIDAYTKSIQSGRIEVDAWQSIMSATPTIVDAVATATGKTAEEVRKLGITGKLSMADLNEGLLRTVELNKEAASGMSATVNDAITKLTNNWTRYIGKANEATQTTQQIAAGIDVLSDNLDTVVSLAITAGEVMAVVWGIKALQALATYVMALKGATLATQTLTLESLKAATAAEKIGMAGKLAAAGWVGWEIGTYLKGEFAEVEKAGIALAAGLTKAAARAQAAWEMAQAVFTTDTLAAANDRLAKELQRIDGEYAELFANVGAAVPKLAADTKAVGDAAADAASKVRVSAADMVEAWEAARVAKVGDAQAAEANLRVQLQLAQQAEQMAAFMGNETEVRKAKILQMQIEIELVNAKVQVQRAEAEGSIAVAKAKLDEMATTNEINLVKQAELQTTIKLAQAKLLEADATGKSTLLLQKQLEVLQRSPAAASDYGEAARRLTRDQAGLASSTNAANAALQKQLDLMNAKYARAGNKSIVGDTREDRLAGQNAVDNTLAFSLRDKLNAGQLTKDDADDIRAVIAALDQNEAVNRDLDRLNPGAFSAAGAADRNEWRAVRTRLEQALGTANVGGTATPGSATGASSVASTNHTVTIKLGSSSTTVNTASARDADALNQFLTGLQDAASRAS